MRVLSGETVKLLMYTPLPRPNSCTVICGAPFFSQSTRAVPSVRYTSGLLPSASSHTVTGISPSTSNCQRPWQTRSPLSMSTPSTCAMRSVRSKPGTAEGSFTPMNAPPSQTKRVSSLTSAASFQASPPLQASPMRPALMTTSTSLSAPRFTSSKLMNLTSTGSPESASLMWMSACLSVSWKWPESVQERRLPQVCSTATRQGRT